MRGGVRGRVLMGRGVAEGPALHHAPAAPHSRSVLVRHLGYGGLVVVVARVHGRAAVRVVAQRHRPAVLPSLD